jgi:hypothetical protein
VLDNTIISVIGGVFSSAQAMARKRQRCEKHP